MDQSVDAKSLRMALGILADPKNVIRSISGDPVDPREAQQDSRELTRLSEHFIQLGTRCLAHAIDDPSQMKVSISDLAETINKIERLSVKYMALVTGIALLARDDGTVIEVSVAGGARAVQLSASAWPADPTMPIITS